MGNTSIEGVGGVRYTQMWVVFVGEQVRQISIETPVGRPDPPMSIVPPAGCWVGGSFLQEIAPRRMPVLQILRQGLFVRLREGRHNDR